MDTKAVEFKSASDQDEGGFKSFIWNPDSKEFCGRDGHSWLKITVFYIIFYCFLAGFWATMLLAFNKTLPHDSPKWTMDDSCIGSSPGVTFRPSKEQPLITWNDTTWEVLVKDLGEFVEAYESENQRGDLVQSCTFNGDDEKSRVCYFGLEQLGNICTKEKDFGYPSGTPCIALKLNRIFDWYPEPYTIDTLPSSMPDYLAELYDPNFVYITCEGDTAVDKENLGPVRYFPEHGAIPNFYFPFRNQDGYLSPFVFVQFPKARLNVLIAIECKAWADNIKHNAANRLGSVRLLLLID